MGEQRYGPTEPGATFGGTPGTPCHVEYRNVNLVFTGADTDWPENATFSLSTPPAEGPPDPVPPEEAGGKAGGYSLNTGLF